MRRVLLSAVGGAILMMLAIAPAGAQEQEVPSRTRVGLGVQLVPSFPGSDEVSPQPLFDLARAQGDQPFEFEAPDESTGFPVLRSNGFAFGPALAFEGKRGDEDVGAALREVGFTFEVGGFVQYAFSDNVRARAEVRKGLGGHNGLIGTVGVDYIVRDRDEWLISIGPRVTLADDQYHDAYFSVTPAAAADSGLPAYSANGGIQSLGGVLGYIQQLSPRWGLYSYAKYNRLVGHPAESPITRQLGSRDQASAGLAVTYTFGHRE